MPDPYICEMRQEWSAYDHLNEAEVREKLVWFNAWYERAWLHLTKYEMGLASSDAKRAVDEHRRRVERRDEENRDA